MFSVMPYFAFVDSEQVCNGAEQAGGCEGAVCSLDDEACAVAGLPGDAVQGSCSSPGTWRINFLAQ